MVREVEFYGKESVSIPKSIGRRQGCRPIVRFRGGTPYGLNHLVSVVDFTKGPCRHPRLSPIRLASVVIGNELLLHTMD